VDAASTESLFECHEVSIAGMTAVIAAVVAGKRLVTKLAAPPSERNRAEQVLPSRN